MNREIKFKAWDTSVKVMVSPEEFWRGDAPYLGIAKKDKGIVIMQFTGLHDKNGVEIYEGDLIWDKEWGFDPKTGKKKIGQVCWA